MKRAAKVQPRSTLGEGLAVPQDPVAGEPEPSGRSLRRRWGGRLRTYRPKPGAETRLEAIRKALVRGELALNCFNRWRLLQARKPAIGWTFTEPGQTEEVAETEFRIARREVGQLCVAVADEATVEEMAIRIEIGGERPDLLIARRDWFQHRALCPPFDRLLRVANARRLVVHVIAALGAVSHPDDELQREARQRWRVDHDPLLRPLPPSSRIERQFGDLLAASGLDPVPQRPVAQYFLDFAVVGLYDGLPVRLDIEVDGRHWHEEMPGRYRPEDELRNQNLKRLGWRPIRFWTDEIEKDAAGCVERIRREIASPRPLASRGNTTEENP